MLSTVSLCLVTVCTVALAGGLPQAATEFDHAAWDAILRDVVRGEGVDYPGVSERHTQSLTAYLDRLSRGSLEQASAHERLAFYINAYNATMVREVALRFRPGYSVSENGFRIFDEPLVRLAEGRMSLNHLEHEIVRRRFEEPRIHAAMVCAARSCPPLIPRAYRAADLEATLDANMRRFVNDATRNTIDRQARRLRLSRIFDWYAEDFGDKPALARYVGRFTEANVDGFDVSFQEYSWELNLAGAGD